MNFKVGRTFLLLINLFIQLSVSYDVLVFSSDASARHMYEICEIVASWSVTSVTP